MRGRPASRTAAIALGCGIASTACVLVAYVLAGSAVVVALAAAVAAPVAGLVALVLGGVAHWRIVRAGGDRPGAAAAGWICGLAGVVLGPFLIQAILFGIAWKNLHKP